jgi:two-component system, sensor histidine kinase
MSDAPWGGTSAPPGQAWEELIRSLREQPQVAEAIFEQLPTGLAIAEAPYGRLLYHNREAIRLIRHPMLPSESFGGYSQYGALHADGTPYRGDEYPIAQALSGRTIIDHEMLYRRGDGTLTTLSVNAAPIHDERGNIILAVSTFHDVSAQRQSAAALRESDARLKVALAGSGLATWTLDTDTWNGSWDRRLAILLGFAPDKLEVTRDEWQTVIHPDDRARVIEDACRDRWLGSVPIGVPGIPHGWSAGLVRAPRWRHTAPRWSAVPGSRCGPGHYRTEGNRERLTGGA